MSLLLAARAIALGSTPPERPVCSAEIHGSFWPEAANRNGRAARELSHCGALEICTSKGRRYRWQAVTVNVRQLGKMPQQPTAACAAVITEFGGSQ